MNRLIIIGNGFDLAHGFETSYKDFLIDYLKTVIKATDHNKPFSDDLLNVYFDNTIPFEKASLDNCINVKEILNRCAWGKVQIVYKNAWFKQLIEKFSIESWTDFERGYYNQLIDAFDHYKAAKSDDIMKYHQVRFLNEYFSILRGKFIEYMTRISSKIENKSTIDKYGQYFNNLFTDSIDQSEMMNLNKLKSGIIKPEQLYFLNFNYTPTLNYYLNNLMLENVSHNQIHGSLFDENNPIILGYGDELDKNYAEIENLNENVFLEHLKSFQYSNTSNYQNLIRFVKSGDFQVYIIGHSCGISDRIMFNKIFESEQCKSIKMFYHQKSETENDFMTKRFDISRHFKNKTKINELIVPFDKSSALLPR